MKNNFKIIIESILNELDYPNTTVNVQIPKNINHGDLTTNIAMVLSKQLKMNPIEIANKIILHLKKYSEYTNIDIAGPGFINVKVDNTSLIKLLIKIKKDNNDYGKNKNGNHQKAIVEFVSANPTGPLTVGHGRGAIIGDVVCRIMEWNGFRVDREYYFNNAGRQMRVLGESLKARYLELCGQEYTFPEDGYQGEYIYTIAKQFKKKYNKDFITEEDINIFKHYAEKKIFLDIKSTLKNLNIKFDNYFNEYELYENKNIDKIINDLKDKGLIYTKDKATWFSGTKVNRPSDRVLIKNTGEPTYRLPDMAYHRTKFDRKYDLIIDIFGADHIDAFPDIIEAMNQLDYDVKKMKVLIHQFVTITKNNKPIKMSTRKANFITLDELCNEVGTDVVRYFFIMRNMNTHLNFELEIAKNNSDENPIFYLQYAHARICTMIKKALNTDYNINNDKHLQLLNQKEESDLILKMIHFPDIIKKSFNKLDPQIISNYLETLAAKFHKYYAKHRIINDDKKLTESRLFLIDSLRIILDNGLNVLGIKAREKM